MVVVASVWAVPCRAEDTKFDELSEIALALVGLHAERESLCETIDADKAGHYQSQLREHLATINQPGLVNADGLSPVDFAVLADDISQLERLSGIGYRFEHAADGGSLLEPAVVFASVEMVTFLLNSGLDPNRRNPYGATPLMVAVSESKPDMVELLLRRGALVNFRTEDGGTALHYAFVCPKPEVIRLLVSADAEVDDKTLQLARKHNLESLLNRKANSSRTTRRNCVRLSQGVMRTETRAPMEVRFGVLP
jgi:ankyrin repeat protein